MRDRDCLKRFAFERFGIRGQIVHLDAAWREVLTRHDYPATLAPLLGQSLAATALLTATLKFDGRMTLQAHGDGPLHLLVAQCTHDLRIRGIARWRSDVPDAGFRAMTGDGRLAISIQPENRPEPYQGVVPLSGATLGECLTDYFETSEQVPTRIWLAADDARAAGLLVQRLPDSETVSDDWQRVQLQAATVRDDELLDLDQDRLLRRLFPEDDLRLFDRRHVRFHCPCSADRIETVLKSLGESELKEILAEQGKITVDCEFCNRQRIFDAVDVARILSDGAAPEQPDSVH